MYFKKYDLLKFMKKNGIVPDSIKYYVVAVYLDKKIINKQTELLKKMPVKFNVEYVKFDSELKKNNEQTIYYDIIGYTKTGPTAFEKIIVYIFNNIITSKELSQTFLLESQISKHPQLVADIICILAPFFEKSFIYSNKYQQARYTIIFFNKIKKINISTINSVHNNKYLYRLLGKNNTQIKNILNKIFSRQYLNYKTYLSIFQMEHRKPDYHDKIYEKLQIYRKYINYEFENKLNNYHK